MRACRRLARADHNGDRVLIVAHSNNNSLYTVDPDTGESARIDGVDIPNVDGILVRGHTVWAVQNLLNQIVRIRLSGDLSSGEIEDTITSPAFDVPTTVARFGNTLMPRLLMPRTTAGGGGARGPEGECG